MLANEAIQRFIDHTKPGQTVLNIGDVRGSEHTKPMLEAGLLATTVSLLPDADLVEDYNNIYFANRFNHVWSSHCLEHQRNPGLFLDKIYSDLVDDGILCITVPPAKADLAGGHVTIWNEAVLAYQLVLSGFDCSQAKVWRYGYNISCLVNKRKAELTDLTASKMDLVKLRRYMPENIG